MEHKETESLLEGVRANEYGSFAMLEECFLPLTHALADSFSVGLCEADRKELCQEGRVALYRAAKTYRADMGVTFGLYAKVCVRNAMVSFCRRHRRQACLFSLDEAERDVSFEEVAPVGTLEEREAFAEMLRRIHGILSPYERRVFDLYVDGETVPRIARTVGKTEKSVSNAVFRIQKKLRGELHY